MIGTRLGPYELHAEIGKGGMATVYRAYQPAMDRQVALKVIHAAILHDAGALDRFRREARLIARLEHPHILPVYDFDGTNAPPYIVMRYLGSGTLKDLLAHQRLTLSAIGEGMAQVASALDYAHAQGIVHRDVKPSNILLDRHGNAFVSDFGIARIMSSQPTGERAITRTGTVVGTPDYMAPEQAMGRADVDGRADQYALGVMLFQLLTGQLPYVSEQPLGVLLQHLQAPIPSASMFAPHLPAAVDEVLRRALAKDPVDRYPSAGALAAAFAAVVGAVAPTTAATINLRAAVTRVLEPREGSITPTIPTPTEQQRVITALYADAAEYTAIVEEAAGAEAAHRALGVLWERARQIVAARGGRILTRREHDLLALWGAEAAGEDDPERALRAALELHAAVRELGAAGESEPLPLTIGVHTGPALLTIDTYAGSYGATGITITLAQRLAAHTPGAIVISHDTFRAVRGMFELLPGEPLRVRGRKEQLGTYTVTAAKARAFRVSTPEVEGIETRMVGREAELKQLQSAFRIAVEDAETQVITVIGEAGLGKSRLLYAFDTWAELRPERFFIFRGRASATMTQRPYALLRDLLSFRFAILDNDSVAAVREKLETGIVELLGSADPEIAHLAGHLAGFDFSDSPYVQGLLGDPRQLAARAQQLVIRLFARLSTIQPTVIQLEDLHHADDASLNLFNALVSEQQNLPLLLIGLARPALLERRPAWGSGQPFHKRIVLTPLDKSDSRDLARELLQKVTDVPKALRDLLVARSEGNPLYMEELVKMLIDDHVIVKTSSQIWQVEESRLGGVHVPPTLIGLLQARLDTLLYPEKLTLQRAAVVGRIFFDSALAALDRADETHLTDLPHILQTLAARGFIERRETSSFAGSVEYIFAQAMLRDLISETLLRRQRQTYHAAMAAWLAGSERAEEYLPLIAEHYEHAGDLVQAVSSLTRAGDKALGLSAFADALGFYERALALADQRSTTNDQRPMIGDEDRSSLVVGRSSLLVKQAEAYFRRSDFPAAHAALHAALSTAQDDADRAAALTLLGEIASALGDYADANAWLADALPLARVRADGATLAHVLYVLGDISWRLGKLADARTYLEESLDLAQRLGDPTRTLFALNGLAAVAHLRSDVYEAERLLQEVHKLAIAVGNRERAMTALNNLGAVADARGEQTAAHAYTQQALTIAREIGSRQNIALYLLNLGELDIKLGDLAAARARLHEGLVLARSLGALLWVVAAVQNYALLAAAEGNMARALVLFGLAQRHPTFSSEQRRQMEQDLAAWGLDTASAEAGMARGADLDFDATVEELLRES